MKFKNIFGKEVNKNINKFLADWDKPCKSKVQFNVKKFFEEFDNRIKDGGSFIFSDSLSDESIKLKKINNNLLPMFVNKNKEKYSHLFC
jgi:hypothetical protein